MIRSIQVSGTLAADPEMRKAGQKEIGSGRLAVSQGAEKPTLWFDLTCWGQWVAASIVRFRKGDRVTVAGRLTMREWTDRDGATRQNLGIDVDGIEGPRHESAEFRERVSTAASRYVEPVGVDERGDSSIPF